MDLSGQVEFSTVTTESNAYEITIKLYISAQLSAFGLSAISEPDQIITLNLHRN